MLKASNARTIEPLQNLTHKVLTLFATLLDESIELISSNRSRHNPIYDNEKHADYYWHGGLAGINFQVFGIGAFEPSLRVNSCNAPEKSGGLLTCVTSDRVFRTPDAFRGSLAPAKPVLFVGTNQVVR